ncbi:uncharacterized protein LOC110441740 [Mizuhopecten yessoensis]|uniref:Bromodomain adjacent to zinc finger domain protein 2B n=1 Tax=Mizuhopecten yessoensis TaxID=6573 RepID=A0A210PIT9_MIZYE|nr:uncharacterized protein LOC110441740 [Mizuhopecten yessoensis]OWF36395.1 Bromodomain adjacent to zinc finger domain protein 2B [Mizuhopecten yessoensis]
MAYNKSDRCSTCLGHCSDSVTVGHNPILLPCGHQSCSRCHQTQWLTSERNDSEEIDCIKCTLAALSEQSSERHDLLMSNHTLFGLANVGAVIRGAAGTHTKVDSADSTNPQLAWKDTCTPGACPQYHRQIYNHRNWSGPADILQTKHEIGWNGTQSCQPSTDMTLVTRELESDNELKDTTLNIKDMSSVCGEVLRFTPLDPKKKHHKKSKKNKKETKQLLSPEKSSKDTTAHVTNKTEAPDLIQPSDSKPRIQTYNEKTHTNVSTKAHTSTHGQDSTCGQNVMEDHATSDNHNQSTSRSHHHHKRSHKKSKKKKKNKEKKRTKSRQDTSLNETSNPECKTNIKVKETESSPQLVHLIACKEDHGNTEEDKLYIAENSEGDKLSNPGKNQGDKVYADRKMERDKLSIAENGKGDILYSSGKSEVGKFSIAGYSESDKLSIDGDIEGDTLPVAGKDGSESEEVTLHCLSCVSLDACASSTRFSSPMSLDDYQLKNLLEDKDIPELEVQNWEDNDKDNTELEVQNLGDHHKKRSPARDGHSPTFLCSSFPTQDLRKFKEFHERNTGKSEFYQESTLEPDITVNPLAETEQDRSETSSDRLSLDGSILDRSGILYYDPIDDSDEDRLVIISRVTSEASLIEDQAAVLDSNTKETVSGIEFLSASNCDSRMAMGAEEITMQQVDKAHGVLTAAKDQVKAIHSDTHVSLAVKKEDQSSITCNISQERDSHLVTTEVDHDQLLQSYLQYLSEKSNNFIDTGKEEDKELQLQEQNLVKGFQESYTTSLICSQLANTALNKIKETRDSQKGPYQLSAKMLTGVLNILVQQANLASTICSELLYSTEKKQAELLEVSDATSTPDNIAEDVTKKAGDNQIRVGAETYATINIALGNISGTSDLGNNSHSLNASISSSNAYTEEVLADAVQFSIKQEQICSERYHLSSTVPSSKPSLLKETSTCNATKDSSGWNMSTDINDSSNPKSVIILENGNQATTYTKISKSTDKSDKDKSSEDSLSNIFSNLDTKQHAVRSVSRASIREAKVCIHKANSAKTKYVQQYQECSHKDSAKKTNHSSTRSFVHSKMLDIPCYRHKGKGKKHTVDEKDVSRSDLPTGGRKDEVKVMVSSSQSKLSDLTSVHKITPNLSEDGIRQASLGTQVTESDIKTVGYKPDRSKGQTPENFEQRSVKSNKHNTTDKNSTHSGKNIDKDRESNNLNNNQPKPPNGKRNLFDSILLEIEEGVVESPCKYRKLQFGKLPQSHAEDGNHLDTPGSFGKVSIDTAGTISLSKQKCRNEVNTRQGSEIRHKSKETPQSLSNKLAGNASAVVPSPKATPEIKLTSIKSSTRRGSSSLPTSHRDSDSKDRSKSGSKYHSSCCSSRHRDSSSNHKNRGSDRKATQGPSVSGNVYVVIHGSKRDICIQTDLQNVHQTPGKSKRKLDMNKGDTISQPSKATGDAVHSIREGISKEKEQYTVNRIKSKDKEKMKEINNGLERETVSKNKTAEDHGENSSKLQCPKVDKQSERHFPRSYHTGPQRELVKQQSGDSESSCIVPCDGVTAQSLVWKSCDEEHSSDLKTLDVNQGCSDLLKPIHRCSKPTSSMVLKGVENDAGFLTPQDETRTRRDQTRDEEIFACLSFSDSDDDIPLALILENLRADKRKDTNTATSVNDLEDDQLPKMAVPYTSKHTKHSQRRSRCDRPGLKTYLEIRNSMSGKYLETGISLSGNSIEKHSCSETPDITWRNSLMPPPLEAVRRSKSRENATMSTSTDSRALSAPRTTPSGSEATSGNLSSDSTHASDPKQGHLSDVESYKGNKAEQGSYSSKKKKRHRRRKSEKPVVSSSSEECIPKGRRRGFQWRQECLRILDRVYNHHFSEPFRHEVKSKDIPDYYKIVKRGMCFDIIGYKLRCNIYEELRDFFLDVRLVFENCRLYYKPQSPIYRAGLVVRYFFRKIAKEVLMPRTTAMSRHPS